MTVAAHAKINLALVVGPLRSDGKHEVVTVLQRVDLADSLTLDAADELLVTGFDADTLVTCALTELAAAARVEPRWHVRIEKRIPVAAGLGGGSSDAAAALALANATLPEPLEPERLLGIAAALGSDVPFFLAAGAQLGTGDGSELEALDLPLDYQVLLLVPHDAVKESTGHVYEQFDRRGGAEGFDQRRARLVEVLHEVRAPRDLANLPPNDLARSPLAAELERREAFRADVSGAGPALYGLFEKEDDALAAAAALGTLGAAWVCSPYRGTLGAS